jgi:hypothetical protein
MLTANNAADKEAVAAAGAIPLLVELLHGDSYKGRANAAIALGILAAGDDAEAAVAMVDLLRGNSA